MYKTTIVEGIVSGTISELDYLVARSLSKHSIFNNTTTTLVLKRFVLSIGETVLEEAEHYDDLLLCTTLQSNQKGSISYRMIFAEGEKPLLSKDHNITKILCCEERARSRTIKNPVLAELLG